MDSEDFYYGAETFCGNFLAHSNDDLVFFTNFYARFHNPSSLLIVAQSASVLAAKEQVALYIRKAVFLGK